MKKGNVAALLPIGVFLCIYLGLGIAFEYVMKIPMGFYNVPIIIAFLAAILVACLQNRKISFDGKLEIMAQEGKMLDTPCGYDADGNPTCDPQKICESGRMMPMAMWKGSALSIMLDLCASMLSAGRTSRMIGLPIDGEKGMSQVFIAIHPAAVVDMKAVEAQMEETIAFLHSLPPIEDGRGVHAPGEGLDRTRAKNRENGIPVTEETWCKILELGRVNG